MKTSEVSLTPLLEIIYDRHNLPPYWILSLESNVNYKVFFSQKLLVQKFSNKRFWKQKNYVKHTYMLPFQI